MSTVIRPAVDTEAAEMVAYLRRRGSSVMEARVWLQDKLATSASGMEADLFERALAELARQEEV